MDIDRAVWCLFDFLWYKAKLQCVLKYEFEEVLFTLVGQDLSGISRSAMGDGAGNFFKI